MFWCEIREKETKSVKKRPMFSPGQKPMTLTSHLIRKYTQHEAIVLASCIGTRATSKNCFVIIKHRKFIELECDSDCLSLSRPALRRIFAKQAVVRKRERFESGDVQAVDKLYFKLSCAENETERMFVWKNP